MLVAFIVVLPVIIIINDQKTTRNTDNANVFKHKRAVLISISVALTLCLLVIR